MTWTDNFTGTRTLDVAPEAIVEGSTFADRYAIERRIGAGAQSTVYSALDMLTTPPRRVALKIARPIAANDASLVREAEMLGRVHRHGDVAGVVRLVEPSVREFGGVEYLVLEHIDGPTLRECANQKSFSLADICRLGVVLARTLATLHKTNIALADVKPDNILLREGIEPVIVDFGAAQEIHDAYMPPLLTPAYASPEQRAGRSPTPASDVYSLAVVLEELAAPRSLNEFDSAFAQCKATDPTQRPSALEFSYALEVGKNSPSRKAFRWVIVGLVGLAMGLAGLFAVMMKPSPERANTASMISGNKSSLTMIFAQDSPLYMALGDAYVHWTDGNGRRVYRARIGGGDPEIIARLDNPTHQMALADGRLFIRCPGEIWSLTNGKLVRFAESTGRGGIAADAQNAVWTNEVTGDVMSRDVRGTGPLRVLASGQARPYSVTMDASHVYWANEGNGTLARVARDGGPVEVLVRGQSLPASTALDEMHLYWMDRAAGFIMRVRKSGGDPRVITRTTVGGLSTALDGMHLYWTSAEDGRVMRVRKSGGVAEVLARGQRRPFDIVAHGNEVFFTNMHHEGTVMRLVVP